MDEHISKKDVLQKIESAAMWNRSLDELYDEIRDMQPVDAATGPMTNGDRIRATNDEELACWLCDLFDVVSGCHNKCPGRDYCNGGDGKANGLITWLQQPAEEDNT